MAAREALHRQPLENAMSKANPTRPDAPEDEARVGAGGSAPDSAGPPLRDPRSRSAIDNIGVDEQGDLLDVALDDQVGDDGNGPNFADDVRSDGNDDERNERR
jgi:hypothetical protein